MTDHELAKQIVAGCEQALERIEKSNPQTYAEWEVQVLAQYLTGISQAADFLVRADGGVSPQQMTRACVIAAEKFGFSSDQSVLKDEEK